MNWVFYKIATCLKWSQILPCPFTNYVYYDQNQKLFSIQTKDDFHNLKTLDAKILFALWSQNFSERLHKIFMMLMPIVKTT